MIFDLGGNTVALAVEHLMTVRRAAKIQHMLAPTSVRFVYFAVIGILSTAMNCALGANARESLRLIKDMALNHRHGWWALALATPVHAHPKSAQTGL